MTALIIVDLIPSDEDQLSTYSALAAKSLLPFGGEFVAKGKIEILHGKSAFQKKVIIQFPDRASAIGWYNSESYQQIIPIRDAAMQLCKASFIYWFNEIIERKVRWNYKQQKRYVSIKQATPQFSQWKTYR